MADPNLVTTCNFHGQEFLFKMNIIGNNLEILITDKSSGEEWQCSYDATYIENLTHKTGNFKQFDIFIAMIKSGLLRTSESVTLDLLTFEDLELLRSRKITKAVGPSNNNRRYLIVTYVVEFDKIRYPLPLEYCGPPDPVILQATIRRLELELARAREELAIKSNNNDSKKIFFLQKRIDELTEENVELQEEVRRLTKQFGKKPRNQVLSLQKAVSTLEKCVVNERNSHHELVEKLRNDKIQLAKELAKVKCSEKNLKAKLNKVGESSRLGLGDHLTIPAINKASHSSLKTMYKRCQSPGAEYDRARSRQTESLKPNNHWAQPRKTKSSVKCVRSRGSSSSSTKYADPECIESNENVTSFNRNHSLSPHRTKSLFKSRGSSPESRTSSRGSSRSCRADKQHLNYKKLEEKIANLHKLLKSNGICDKEI
ncbi:centrosomal protein CCDC61-like [Diorhabda sublineata]|uniref:centrosomal protein CCDC61-like n=1 Tax=Diorhabda sublineata TaxID=1163346 RepID=UPI0024E1395E|nr:centrosomal protein CCDC61-like [Diorhabda sublineata]